jgi:hypothetical protein
MDMTIFQISEERLTEIINSAIRNALPKDLNAASSKPFIKGITELAAFLGVSKPKAQELKNAGIFPYFQDERTILFDPEAVRAGMKIYMEKIKKVKK